MVGIIDEVFAPKFSTITGLLQIESVLLLSHKSRLVLWWGRDVDAAASLGRRRFLSFVVAVVLSWGRQLAVPATLTIYFSKIGTR